MKPIILVAANQATVSGWTMSNTLKRPESRFKTVLIKIITRKKAVERIEAVKKKTFPLLAFKPVEGFSSWTIFSDRSSAAGFGPPWISSSTVVSKAAASRGNVWTSGQPRPRSHFETALFVTKIFSASSFCVRPWAVRNSLMYFPIEFSRIVFSPQGFSLV